MHTSPEITFDMTTDDLLKTLSDESCFEVDDIAALDLLASPPTPPPVAKAADPDPANSLEAAEVTIDMDSLEIELTAEDMNALFDGEATDKVR